ncbi:MAG: DUF4097 domain-containing protein [Ruminococcaceae bacterium]|nr:DUF4097 domain-containing protein [Oscillospiraceae bacterium]
MTTFQKIVKYGAIALAVVLIINIISGILGVFGLLGFVSEVDEVTGEMKLYSVGSDVSALEINVGAAELVVESSDNFEIESNHNYLAVEEKNGKLVINETKHFPINPTDTTLTVRIPEGVTFEKVEITTGAGRLTADSISAERLTLSLGAGEVTIGELYSTKSADIDGGAGQINIRGGALHSLDFDMGVGELNFVSALSGECEFDLGVGSSNITVSGSRNDYSVDIDKGLGDISVDGESIRDFSISGNSKNSIEINGGVGNINLDFEEN